jgi:hypothetical protein
MFMDDNTADTNDAPAHTTGLRRFLQARLHKKRTGVMTGLGDAAQPSRNLSKSDASTTDPYAALRDIDVFGQKSDDGVNRTDDPSRGPIE